MNNKILMIDNDKENLDSTAGLLEEWGYTVTKAYSGQEGILKGASPDFAIILIDYRMPGLSGVEVTKELKKVNSESILLMYSCDDSTKATRAAWAAGVTNFIDKSLDPLEFRKIIEDYCIEYHETRKVLRNEMSSSALAELIGSVGMVGRSSKLAGVVRIIKRFQKLKDNVMILGETGVGKELVASAIHHGPPNLYKRLNCANFKSSNLLESELFGSEKGSFTGALSRIGVIEAANGGTVFFDELHQLDLDAQSKLLRVFQEKHIKRVGGRDEYPINFRIVTAVQPDIENRIEKGLFQEDLYYRVNVLSIEVPPLRERLEDIEPLVRHFCNQHFEETGERKFFLAETIKQFENFHWPGNIRQLRNVVKKALASNSEEVIQPKHLDKKLFNAESKQPILNFSLFKKKQDDDLRDYLEWVLKMCDGNAASAAGVLRLPTSTFYDLLKKFDLRKPRSLNMA
jgi:DNA-binding NtrC family response regulator